MDHGLEESLAEGRLDPGVPISTPRGSAVVRRQRVPADAARRRTIDKAIEILSVEPFPTITSRTIAQAAEVSHSSILRNFGSMEGLFVAVVRELNERFAERARTLPPSEITIDDNAVLRSRLVAWMLGEGMDPAKISTEHGGSGITALAGRVSDLGDLSDKMVRIFTEISLFIGEGFAAFSPVHHNLNDSDVLDAITLIDWFRQHLTEAERDLGWFGDGLADGVSGRASDGPVDQH
jgi:AcrR family transcriptional regulator